MDSELILKLLFDTFSNIRYIALYKDGKLVMKQKENINDSSSNKTDEFEELLVNPTLLKLTSQRGNIDCGGLDYVLVKYGNFFQLIKAITNGHISISLDAKTDINTIPHDILNVLRTTNIIH
nr:hypothetical protein [uncultured Psychroserpens sp.]